MKSLIFVVLGIVGFVWFWGFVFYATGFLLNFYVPKSIDSGVSDSLVHAFGINTLLILFFGIQHSVMARKFFKRAITKLIPQYFERSFYVLVSNFAMTAMLFFWHPIAVPVWSIENTYIQILIYSVFAIGSIILVYSLWIIDFFEYIGFRQIYFYLKEKEYRALEFKTPTIYKYIRHPMYLGTLIVFWTTPQMTLGHLFFALGMTLYTFIGMVLEERDLQALYGKSYTKYMQTVGRLFPKIKR